MATLAMINPQKIIATELYDYEINIRNAVFVKPESTPVGIINLFIPYDGEKYFPKVAADELIQRNDIDQLRIGWLAIGRPKNWLGDWRQKTGADIIEVQVPLRTNEINDKKWTSDEVLVHMCQEYALDLPRYYPLNIDFEVLDSDARSKFLGLKLPKMKTEESLLSFEMLVQLSLPTYPDADNLRVWIDKMNFTWPKFASENQIKIHVLKINSDTTAKWEKVDWSYAPERNEVETVLSPIQLKRNNAIAGSPLSTYEAIFHFDFFFSVGDLLEKGGFTGNLALKVENSLLSGREVSWINVDGSERKEVTKRIRRQTLVNSKFIVHLGSRFANKQSYISREWQFPGVTFSNDRIKDIMSNLQDYGYQVRLMKIEEGEATIYVWRSLIQSDHDPFILFINLIAKGSDATQTKRERKEVIEDKYFTEITTQDLVIRLDAQINGPGRILARDVDGIMLRLKNHFTAVADLR